MVTFNEARITDDGKAIVVDCSVDQSPVYSGMYIKAIYIDWYRNYPVSGVASDNAVMIYDNYMDNDDVKSVRTCLKANDIPEGFGTDALRGGLFYAIVQCDGDIDASAAKLACGFDDTVDVAVIPDWKLLYGMGIGYAALLGSICDDMCKENSPFISFILLWNSLKLAVSTCDYSLVNGIWDKIRRMVGSRDAFEVAAGCGCGR